MLRPLALMIALGLTPAAADDLAPGGVLLNDLAFLCDGPCVEAGLIAMSSDTDGDGEPEYVSFSDDSLCTPDQPCDDLPEAQADLTDSASLRHL